VSRRNTLIVGAMGRMGERLRALIADDAALSLAAALERPGHPAIGEELAEGVQLTDDPASALAAAEIAIVFANPEGSLALVRAAAEAGVACVVGTTGFGPDQRKEIEALAKRIPIVFAANFSVAVNVLFHVARESARLLGEGYDAEIVELHHAAKVDAPSGTALRLAEAIAEGREARQRRSREAQERRSMGTQQRRFVMSREGETGARPAGVIGLQALRGGDNPGEHSVLFLGRGERLELVHRAATRDHFARGALVAAAWLGGRAAGLYDMEQVLGLGE
jgi:4-hydroxy-tetrahydrodipicolinate reductase